jgi:hypothetical protein
VFLCCGLSVRSALAKHSSNWERYSEISICGSSSAGGRELFCSLGHCAKVVILPSLHCCANGELQVEA